MPKREMYPTRPLGASTGQYVWISGLFSEFTSPSRLLTKWFTCAGEGSKSLNVIEDVKQPMLLRLEYKKCKGMKKEG